MDKDKPIYLSESKLKEIVKNSIKKVVNENLAISLNNYEYPENSELDEMVRINKKENGKGVFPFDAWELKIWSNDHEPAHFHILKDGWNVSFTIQDGKMLKIDSSGEKQAIFEYMVKNVPTWLESQCAVQPKLSNKENASLQWEQLH